MYKAIIADDEETVRRGLVTHFNWGKHGVEVAGVFDDGVPALDFVRRNEVDIIVTDVRMSHMDGITQKMCWRAIPASKSYLSAAMQMWDICVML